MIEFETFDVVVEDRIAWVTFDHPPINLLDIGMIREISQLAQELEVDDSIHVVVFQSADPDFFIAHADVELIRQMPTHITERPTELNIYVAALEKLRTLPMVTIGKIAGVARGGGCEFLLSLDMRFAGIGKTELSQPEVAIGILPSGSGSVRLPHLLGRSRALEMALGCDNFSAELAERYGLVNRALPVAELDDFVERLAMRIASFPKTAIQSAKLAIDAALVDPKEALLEEAHQFNILRGTTQAQERMASFMNLGAQTREIELDLDALIERL